MGVFSENDAEWNRKTTRAVPKSVKIFDGYTVFEGNVKDLKLD